MSVENNATVPAAHLQALLTALDDIVFEINGEMVFLNVWVRDEVNLFMPKAAFLGQRIQDVMGELSEPLIRVIGEAMKTQKPQELVYPHLDKSKPNWYRATVRTVKEASSLADYQLIIAVRDITEAKQAESEIQEKSRMLNGLLNNLPVVLYRVNAAGIITAADGDGLNAVPGWSNDALVRKNGFEIVPDMKDAFLKGMAGEQCRAVNSFTVGGADFHFDTMVVPDKNNPGGIICFAVDVTTTKRTRRELEESFRQIEQQAAQLLADNNFKDRILSIISHDLRQPMASVMALTSILQDMDDSLSEFELKNAFGELNRMAYRNMRMLDGILLWIKSETKGYVYEPQKVQLWNNMDDANGIFEYDQRMRHIAFINEIGEDTAVKAHEQMLLFVNRNLIGNATKYSPVNGRITARATKGNNNEVIVAISDEGQGIAREVLDKLFSPVDDQRGGSNVQSAGIALSICKDLVTSMGGRIWVDSGSGKGATFFYSLPAV